MYTNIHFNVYLGHITHTKEPAVRFTKVLANVFSLYEFVELVLNYKCNKFIALTNLCETRPCLRCGLDTSINQ